jgi:UDP-glucose 4-epimerase
VRILVTGGAGFIGSHVADRFVADGHDVVVVDNLSGGRREHVPAGASFAAVDLRSPRLDGVVQDARPDAVVHLAAQAAVARSIVDPGFDASVNLVGTAALLQAAARANARRVVYISTGGAAYGDTDVVPTPEDHPTRPTSPYGVSKVGAERYVELYAQSTGGRGMVLRLANVYGPRQSPHGEAGVVAIFCHRLVAGEPCLVTGDGEQTRDFVYVGDVVAAIARALTSTERFGIVNVGTGVETSVNELYRRLAAAAGVSEPARHVPPRPGEQRRSALDATRAKAGLGWSALTSLDDGLKQTFTWFRKEVTP